MIRDCRSNNYGTVVIVLVTDRWGPSRSCPRHCCLRQTSATTRQTKTSTSMETQRSYAVAASGNAPLPRRWRSTKTSPHRGRNTNAPYVVLFSTVKVISCFSTEHMNCWSIVYVKLITVMNSPSIMYVYIQAITLPLYCETICIKINFSIAFIWT